MDIIIEVLLSVYMEFMFLIVPEEKCTKKHKIISVIIACITTFGLMALAFWGMYLIFEENKEIGYLPLMSAIVLSIGQIVAGILLYNKRH